MASALTMKQYKVLRSLSDTEFLQPWRLDTGLSADTGEDKIGAICAELGRMGYAERRSDRRPVFWRRTQKGSDLLGLVASQ